MLCSHMDPDDKTQHAVGNCVNDSVGIPFHITITGEIAVYSVRNPKE